MRLHAVARRGVAHSVGTQAAPLFYEMMRAMVFVSWGRWLHIQKPATRSIDRRRNRPMGYELHFLFLVYIALLSEGTRPFLSSVCTCLGFLSLMLYETMVVYYFS